MTSHGRKPPDPRKVPKQHGRKPSSPVTAPRNNRRKPPPPPKRSGKSVLQPDSNGGCAVTAVALGAGLVGVVSAIGYGISELVKVVV